MLTMIFIDPEKKTICSGTGWREAITTFVGSEVLEVIRVDDNNVMFINPELKAHEGFVFTDFGFIPGFAVVVGIAADGSLASTTFSQATVIGKTVFGKDSVMRCFEEMLVKHGVVPTSTLMVPRNEGFAEVAVSKVLNLISLSPVEKRQEILVTAMTDIRNGGSPLRLLTHIASHINIEVLG